MSEGQPKSDLDDEATKRRISHDTLGNEYAGGEVAIQGRLDPRKFDEPGVPGGFPRDAAGREIVGATRKSKPTDGESSDPLYRDIAK